MAALALQDILDGSIGKLDGYLAVASHLSAAPSDTLDANDAESLQAEGIFCRSFTVFESTLESLFLYFLAGGSCLNGFRPTAYISGADHARARKIMLAGRPVLDWANPAQVRDRALLLFDDGKPFADALIRYAQPLSDSQKIRNRIAHDSPEALNAFRAVERNVFRTERIFPMSAGQLLRNRKGRSKSRLWLEHYVGHFKQTLSDIANCS